MNSEQNSVMVVLDTDQYCFLYDRHSFPELLEELIESSEETTENAHGMRGHEAREIARELVGEMHATL